MKKLVFAVAALVGPFSAHAQTYPSRPIIVVGGVGTESVGRTIAEHMKTSLGQPIVFENTTGAGGAPSLRPGSRAQPPMATL